MSPDIDGGVSLGADWLPECSLFMRHWQHLRGTARIPTSENFFDCPPAALLPSCYVADISSHGAVVRFHGTELINRWGRDFTNVELHDGRPKAMKMRSLENMAHIVNRPCGMILKLVYSTSTGRRMTSEMIQLPLVAQAARPPRIVAFSVSQDVRELHETVFRYLKTHRLEWIELGAGVPNEPPFDLAS